MATPIHKFADLTTQLSALLHVSLHGKRGFHLFQHKNIMNHYNGFTCKTNTLSLTCKTFSIHSFTDP